MPKDQAPAAEACRSRCSALDLGALQRGGYLRHATACRSTPFLTLRGLATYGWLLTMTLCLRGPSWSIATKGPTWVCIPPFAVSGCFPPPPCTAMLPASALPYCWWDPLAQNELPAAASPSPTADPLMSGTIQGPFSFAPNRKRCYPWFSSVLNNQYPSILTI